MKSSEQIKKENSTGRKSNQKTLNLILEVLLDLRDIMQQMKDNQGTIKWGQKI